MIFFEVQLLSSYCFIVAICQQSAVLWNPFIQKLIRLAYSHYTVENILVYTTRCSPLVTSPAYT